MRTSNSVKDNTVAKTKKKMEVIDGGQKEVIKDELVEVSEERRQLFETVMANLKASSFDENGKVLTANGSIPLSLCYVNDAYQRLRRTDQVMDLANAWDVRILDPISLVPDYVKCMFSIVNGQKRSLSAKILGIDRLQATVFMDAPKDPEERLRFEAEYFIRQDTETDAVKAIEKHKARVIIGDPIAVKLDKILKCYRVGFTNTKGVREEGVLGSYIDAYEIVRKYDDKCLHFIFSIIENAGWNREKNGYSTYVMRALRNCWCAHDDAKERNKIHEFLSGELRQMDPALFGANGRTRYPKRDLRAACTLYLEDIVCEGMGIPKKIYIEGERKFKIVK